MAEPEELILEGAHFATRLARDAWRRYGPPAPSNVVLLAQVRARLELFVSALVNTSLTIAASAPPAPASWLSQLANRSPRHLRDEPLLPGTDGSRIYLPPALVIQTTGEDTLALFRLLAVEQAVRLARGTARALGGLHGRVARDRFALAEGAIVDRWIALHAPGLRSNLAAARAAALARRPPDRALSASELAFERQLRTVLNADPETPGLDLAMDAPVAESIAWAWSRAAGGPADYRGIAPVWYWGRVMDPVQAVGVTERQGPEQPPSRPARPPAVAEMRRRPRVREAAEDEDDEGKGTWVIRADEPQESVEDPFGLQRPVDRADDADPEGLGDSLSELPEARVVRTPGQAREVLRSGEEVARAPVSKARVASPKGIAYPEWDYRIGRYREPGAVVHEPEAPLGDPGWIAAAMERQGRLARRVRARFERLRPRHVRLGRQPDGPELDIDACVTTAADMRAGGTVDGRLYVALRPARRELTVALLVDVSASTDSWVSGNRRIIDVEKEALLVVGDALDALGDPYGIFAFSGEGPEDVSVLPLKAFAERSGLTVRRRIAALESDRYTRIGTAIRHVTAALGRQQTRRRLLLALSDGKPNDVDVYEGRYGVEDARQAVAEARMQGVTVFCLTVDREAPRYAARLFGPAGFAVLHRPEQLPAVLVDALRQLIR